MYNERDNESLENKLSKDMEQKYEVGEDSTKYGEFISSYFAWISLPKQKERAKELDNMTKKQNNKEKKEREK